MSNLPDAFSALSFLNHGHTSTDKYRTLAQLRELRRPRQARLDLPGGPFPFMDLPQEIKDLIYRELLLLDIPMMLFHDRPVWPNLPGKPGRRLYPAILQTCKKAWQEAIKVLYSENTWYMHIEPDVETDIALLQDSCYRSLDAPEITLGHPIGAANAALIRRVVVYSDDNTLTLGPTLMPDMFLKHGVYLWKLQLWAIKLAVDEEMDLFAETNRLWLKKVRSEDIEQKAVWFPSECYWLSGFWLVAKTFYCIV